MGGRGASGRAARPAPCGAWKERASARALLRVLVESRSRSEAAAERGAGRDSRESPRFGEGGRMRVAD